MGFVIRPAVREDTPLIIGIAGPSKSGKTYSAHRLAVGLAGGGPVVMMNAEGARGHQYADRFKYHALDIDAPFSYTRYDEALEEVKNFKPAVVIIDSISHAHDGPGGMLEQHDAEIDKRAKGDDNKRDNYTWLAWNIVKAPENRFIYTMLGMNCPVILCFRAKEKIKVQKGKAPIDLGYQPIASERISFETMFSLMLPPRSKGVPDLALSDLREPFDTMIPEGQPITEELGETLAKWAAGKAQQQPRAALPPSQSDDPFITPDEVANLETQCQDAGIPTAALRDAAKVDRLSLMPKEDYPRALEWIERRQKARKSA